MKTQVIAEIGINHQGDVNISAAERQELYNLIRRLAPPPVTTT